MTLEYFRSRQQELETEHKAVEQQLRELVEKPGMLFLRSHINPLLHNDTFEISCS